MQATLKKKPDADFRPYKILGARNPLFALKALMAEDQIGLMLPCNVVIQQKGDRIQVSAIDPVASMAAVQDPALGTVATEIRSKLSRVIDSV